MRVVDIIAGTTVDGPGLRTTIYFGGCDHHCPGCHNPQTWPHDSGSEMTIDEVMAAIRDNDFNVTFSGGDPLLQIDAILPLAQAIKAEGYTLWVYTGYTIEQIKQSESLRRILLYADAVVDGPFVESLRDISLPFRGSSNQRIITDFND